MKDGIGQGYTREDHSDLANQLFSSYAKVSDARNLAQVIGRDDLSVIDQTYLDFGDAFEQRFLAQLSTENRSLDQSFSIGWDVLKILPISEMDRLTPNRIRQFIEG